MLVCVPETEGEGRWAGNAGTCVKVKEEGLGGRAEVREGAGIEKLVGAGERGGCSVCRTFAAGHTQSARVESSMA